MASPRLRLGWALDLHCHMHVNTAGATGQTFHKDGAINGNARSHRPRLGLLMYYPHEVAPAHGPTAAQLATDHDFLSLHIALLYIVSNGKEWPARN